MNIKPITLNNGQQSLSRLTSIYDLMSISSDEFEQKGKVYEDARRKILVEIPAPSEHLAYILGVCLGDAYVQKTGKTYRIVLTTSSNEFADKFEKSVKNIGLNVIRVIDREKYPRVVVNSKMLNLWYRSQTIQDLRQYIKGYELKFLQGFWDSEGSTGVYHKSQIEVRMFNTNVEMLMIFEDIIQDIGIDCKIYGPYDKGANHKDLYHLAIIGGNKNATRFLSLLERDVK